MIVIAISHHRFPVSDSSSTAKLLGKHYAQHLLMMEQNHCVIRHPCVQDANITSVFNVVTSSSHRLAWSFHLVCLCESSTSRCALSSHPPCSSVNIVTTLRAQASSMSAYCYTCQLLALASGFGKAYLNISEDKIR